MELYEIIDKLTDKIIITYAGNIGEGQGLEKIITKIAIKLGNSYEIHIIGDGGRKKALVEKLDGINNVKLFNLSNLISHTLTRQVKFLTDTSKIRNRLFYY